MDALETPRLDFFPIVAPTKATTEGTAPEQSTGQFAQALALVPSVPDVASSLVPEGLAVADPSEIAADLATATVIDWSTSIPWVTSSLPSVEIPTPIATNDAASIEVPNDLPVDESALSPAPVQDAQVTAPVLTTIISQHLPTTTAPTFSAPAVPPPAAGTSDNFSTPVSFGLAVVHAALPSHLTVTTPQPVSNPEAVGEEHVRSTTESASTNREDAVNAVPVNIAPSFVVHTLPITQPAVTIPLPINPPTSNTVVDSDGELGATSSPSETTKKPAEGPTPRDNVPPVSLAPNVPVPISALPVTSARVAPLAPVIASAPPPFGNNLRDSAIRVKLATTEIPTENAITPASDASNKPVVTTPGLPVVPQPQGQPEMALEVATPASHAETTSPAATPTLGVSNGSIPVANPVPRPVAARVAKPLAVKRDAAHEHPSTRVAEPPVAPAFQQLVAAMTPTAPNPVSVPADSVAKLPPIAPPTTVASAPVNEALPAIITNQQQSESVTAPESALAAVPAVRAVDKSSGKTDATADNVAVKAAMQLVDTTSPESGRTQPPLEVSHARTTSLTDAVPTPKISPEVSPVVTTEERDSNTVTTAPQRMDLSRTSPSALDFGDPVPIHPAAQLVQRLGDAIGFAQESGQELSIRVTPPQFGPIVVEVRMHDGALTARVETHSTIAHEAITEHLPQLQESLTARGATLDRIEIVPVENRVHTDRHTTTDDAPAPRESSSNGWMSSGASGGQGADTQDQQRRRQPRPLTLPTAEPAPVPTPTNTGRPMELQGLNVRV